MTEPIFFALAVDAVLTVDCGCRSVLDVTATKAQTSVAVLTGVDRDFVVAFGDPANVGDGVELRTDHGPQYSAGRRRRVGTPLASRTSLRAATRRTVAPRGAYAEGVAATEGN